MSPDDDTAKSSAVLRFALWEEAEPGFGPSYSVAV